MEIPSHRTNAQVNLQPLDSIILYFWEKFRKTGKGGQAEQK